MRKTKILRGVISSILIVVIIVVAIVLISKPAQKVQQPTASNSNQPTQLTKITALTAEQKKQIVAILTANTDHFKQLWQDGKEALAKTQTPAFTQFKQTKNPANDNSFIEAMNQADVYYSQANLSDQPLHTWSDDMNQVSSDMGIWVNDATGWQIGEISTSKLNSDADRVNSDFVTIQKDIQAIGD